MNTAELSVTARALVAKNRGILAADESTSTIKKRFDSIKLDSTEENRRAYREMLFTAPGAQEFISGVIMYDETLRQKTKEGGAVPGLPRAAWDVAWHQSRHGGETAGRLCR
jgi:fructose-bisphosphate aldolase class I